MRALRNIGFIEAAKKGDITFVLFHILGPSIASLDEIVDTAAYLGDAKYFLVKNFINNTYFFEWDEATTAAYFKRIPDAVEITIPKLAEMAAEQVDLASVPFANFIANKKQSGASASYSFVLRGYVRHWLGTIWPSMIVLASPMLWSHILWRHRNLRGRLLVGRAPSSRLRRHSGSREGPRVNTAKMSRGQVHPA